MNRNQVRADANVEVFKALLEIERKYKLSIVEMVVLLQGDQNDGLRLVLLDTGCVENDL